MIAQFDERGNAILLMCIVCTITYQPLRNQVFVVFVFSKYNNVLSHLSQLDAFRYNQPV